MKMTIKTKKPVKTTSVQTQASGFMTLKVGKKTIFFDPEKHKFTDESGKKINSVTKFTGIIDKSAALIGWAIKLTRVYLTQKLERGEQIIQLDVEEACKQHRLKKEEAGSLGTQVHDWVSNWIKNKNTELPKNPDERVINGIQAFLSFQSEYKFKWLHSEHIIYSMKHNYAGILDAIATDKDGKKVLVDFKTSNGLYPEYAFQAAAYQLAWEEMTGEKIDYRIIIRFGKETGDFEFRIYEDGKADMEAFLAAKTLTDRLAVLNQD